MSDNIHNGGLIMKTRDELFLTDIQNYKGTHILNTNTTLVNGLFWFMNHHGNYVYYSDQLRENALCRMSVDSRNTDVLINKPCYKITLYRDWLYYINEDEGKLYRCTLEGKDEECVFAEQVESFLIDDGEIIYSTKQGIRRCNESGLELDILSDILTSSFLHLNDKLAVIDQRNGNRLTVLDLNNQTIETLDNIQVSSMNKDHRYLYCANTLNNGSIYRVDPFSGSSIRICGESADYLHVIDEELYFCNQREWRKISLTGGESIKISL